MADYSRKFEASRTYVEGDATPTYTVLSGTTEEFSADINLESHQGVHVEVEVKFDSAPINDVWVRVYPSDDGTYDGEEEPCYEYRVERKTSDSRFLSFCVEGYAHFRLGFQQIAGDSHEVRAWHRRWKATDA